MASAPDGGTGAESHGGRARPTERRSVPSGLSVEVGLRAALAVGVPLLVLLAVGRLDLTAYATFGAFTALYGRNEPYRLRIRSVSVGAVALLVSITLGILVAALGEPLWLLAPLLLVIVAGGTLLAATFQLIPAQPLFFVFALLVCAAVPTPAADIVPRVLLAASVAVFSWLLTMSGWLLRRARGLDRGVFGELFFKELRRAPSVDRGAVRDLRVWLTIAQNLLGVLIAGGIALLFGLGHAYWAIVSLVAVIPPARSAHSISRSVHRIVGTVVGVGVTVLLLFWSPPPLFVIAVIVVCQVFAEILVGRHYGSALVFITPMALSVSHLVSPVPLSVLAVDRVLETVLGAGVGIVLVLAARWVERRFVESSGRRGAPAAG
ncbi:FUSC family protein [Leifsonia poae]|uniref:FUSC family protein n=1 Tax=Leifsonia poae TaxID=110933 RepID=A0A9W6LYM2_9MICO|nr:FUSC family protein [Leifsonia poae]